MHRVGRASISRLVRASAIAFSAHNWRHPRADRAQLASSPRRSCAKRMRGTRRGPSAPGTWGPTVRRMGRDQRWTCGHVASGCWPSPRCDVTWVPAWSRSRADAPDRRGNDVRGKDARSQLASPPRGTACWPVARCWRHPRAGTQCTGDMGTVARRGLGSVDACARGIRQVSKLSTFRVQQLHIQGADLERGSSRVTARPCWPRSCSTRTDPSSIPG